MKNLLLAAVLFAVGCGVAGLLALKRPIAEDAIAPTAKAVTPAPASPRPAELPPVPVARPPAPSLAPAPVPEATATTPPKETATAKSASPPPVAAKAPKAPKPPPQDLLARDALALVGMDPAAEEYWYSAINDPNLSDHERQDLIEDLNEDGLSDPKNPAPEDLPVILNRIRLIERAAPNAMDQVNADAFQEAYKDLVNLADRVFGAGTPVR